MEPVIQRDSGDGLRQDREVPGTDHPPRRICGDLWLCLQSDAHSVERLAVHALAWSPRISIVEGESAVLVEIGGSLRLFGGLDGIIARCPVGARWAVGPTPRAALWLMRGAPGTCVDSPARLAGTLGGLPLAALALPRDVERRLRGFGLRRVRDLVRLPRAALARRAGQETLDALRCALGESPDPQCGWRPVPRYSGRRELAYESGSDAVLLAAIDPLFDELAALSRATGRGVRRCAVLLVHRGIPATRIRLGTLEPVRDPERLRVQLAIQLERTSLPAPVTAVALHVPSLEPSVEGARDLFAPRASGEGWLKLLERLQARLGQDALTMLRLHADHRPERAWERRHPRERPGGDESPGPTCRPLWLLTDPRPVRADRYHMVRGPERIESGWWDGADARRDYFVADDGHGARYWVFRERRPSYRWYLHGLFG
jgi:protein ImuB